MGTKKDTGRIAPEKASRIRNVGQASALVTKSPPVSGLALKYEDTMASAKDHIGKGLQMLTAAVAMRDLTPPQMASVMEYASDTLDAVEEAKKLVRGRVLAVALSEGEVTTEKGSRRLDLGNGKYVPITPQKTGTDPGKFEQGLREKKVPVQKYMEATVSYKLKADTQSQDMAIGDGVFTADEVKAMDYELKWRVDRVKEAKGE